MNYSDKIKTTRPSCNETRSLDVTHATERDRGNIIQSAALRRLQQKTQVYPLETNASVRSRLTHSLEVQQIGRYIAQTILSTLKKEKGLKFYHLDGLETAFISLVEMACLVHDVGNPPFAHFGEATISRWMQDNALHSYHQSLNSNQYSSFFYQTLLHDLHAFEGNAQGLRIMHNLQKLDLTYTQFAAAIKYTLPAYNQKDKINKHACSQKKVGFYYSEQSLIHEIQAALQIGIYSRHPLVYIMEAADDIAYCIADLEDSIDKGLLSLSALKQYLINIWLDLRSGNDNYLLDIIKEAEANIKNKTFIISFRDRLIKDLVEYAAIRYIENHQQVFDGTLSEALIEGSSSQHIALKTMKQVAVNYIFHSKEKEILELRGYTALTGLLNIYRPLLELPYSTFSTLSQRENNDTFVEQRLYKHLSKKYVYSYENILQTLKAQNTADKAFYNLEWYYRARMLLDYISGMTDNFVISEYQKLYGI